MGINTKSVPLEAHNSIGMVERFHTPLRRIYRIITVELPNIGKEMALQMTFKAINDTAGLDGLVPTLLVFGAYPRMVDSDKPNPTVQQRATALRKAMEEVRKVRAERQVADALNTRKAQTQLQSTTYQSTHLYSFGEKVSKDMVIGLDPTTCLALRTRTAPYSYLADLLNSEAQL
jgi:hypothetical protein